MKDATGQFAGSVEYSSSRCSRDGQTLEMPAELVDYVLVHELVHVKIPDHGKGSRVMMDYKLPISDKLERFLAAWLVNGSARGRGTVGIFHASDGREFTSTDRVTVKKMMNFWLHSFERFWGTRRY